MKVNMTKKSKIAIGLVIALLMVTTVAAVNVISNTWTSPKVYVTALPCVISSTWTTDQSRLLGIPFEFDVSIHNPNAAGSFTGVMMYVNVYGTNDPTHVWLQYWDATAATPSWKNITLTATEGHLSNTAWGPAGGFPIAAGQTITNYFRFSASVAGTYYGDLQAYIP
jgi:hypothetical protein